MAGDEKEVRAELVESGVAADVVDAQPRQPVERRAQADRVGDVAGAGLEARRRVLVRRALEGDVLDHVAAALPGRHGLEDLATAQAVGAITHRRMAEQMAKELGFDDYDYVTELDAIKKEQQTIPPDILGVADAVAGAPSKPGGNPAPPGGWVPAPGETDVPLYPKRHDLSGTQTARFRKLQRK